MDGFDIFLADGELLLSIVNGKGNKFAYIPHIDGLRAISFLAIFAFHLRPDLVPGGFLGVDVFFMISGYLISSLLFQEYTLSGRISLKNFYLRRFARLFPSFALTVTTTIIVSFFVFGGNTLSSIAITALASLFGVANIYFFNTANYFDLSALEKPLLHIWSLNVEEQFYLVWPIVFLFVLKKVTHKKSIIASSAFVLFLFSSIVNQVHPVAVFYLPVFRAYEFLAGAALALLSRKTWKLASNSFVIVFLLILLVSTFFIFDSKSYLPGPGTLILSISTLSIIRGGGQNSKYNILRSKLFLYVGKRSYTLYLIHWPFIVIYMKYFSKSTLTKLDVLIITMAIFALSHLVYRYFELPIRLAFIDSARPKLGLLLLTLLAILLSLMTLLTNKLESNAKGEETLSSSAIEQGKQLRFKIRIQICEAKGWEVCDEPVPGKPNLLVVGDSHAVDALNALYVKFPQYNYSMSQLGGCPPTKRMRELVPRTFPDLKKCVQLNLQRYDLNYLSRYDVIAINVLYGWYSPNELADYLRFLHNAGVKKVIVFGEYLEMKEDLPLLINSVGFDESKLNQLVYSLRDAKRSIQKLAGSYNYYYVDKFVNLRKAAPKRFFTGKIPYTWDTHHLSYEFAINMINQDYSGLKQYLQEQKNLQNG